MKGARHDAQPLAPFAFKVARNAAQPAESAPVAQAACASFRSWAVHTPGWFTGTGVVVPGVHWENEAGQVLAWVVQLRGVVSTPHVSLALAQFWHVVPPEPHWSSRKPS